MSVNNSDYIKYLPAQEELCHFINNEFVRNVEGDDTFDVIQPNNGQLLCKVASGSEREVYLAVNAAVQASRPDSPWRKMSISERRALLLKLVARWQEEIENLAILESFNNGSPLSLQKFIVEDLVNDWMYHIGWMDKVAGTVCADPTSNDQRHIYVRREPIGACGLIIPWNVPLWCLIVKLAPALAMGNTVVVKPSEFTPLTCLKVAKMIKECGFPPGVFNIVNGYGPNVGAPLAKHPKIRKIAFTGSTRTGRAIAQYAAESNLKQVQLELGGKSAVIVMPDVNIEEAVRICNFAVFNNNGQLCTAGSRTFVHEQIYEQFVEEAVRQAKLMKVGNQMDLSTNCGPLVNKIQFEKVLAYIKHGMSEGKLRCGSAEPAFAEGYFVQPTIFSDLPLDSKLACEEIFGPVMSIFKFSTIDQVVEAANNTDYGLAAGVVTKDTRVAMEISHRLETNTIWVNHYHGAVVTAEFGGYKESGYGREGGQESVSGWTQSKSIYLDNGNKNI